MDKICSARLDLAVVDERDRTVRRLGVTKKQFLEEAFKLRVSQAEAEGQADVWDETLGAWVRYEPPEATVERARREFRELILRRHRA